MGAMGSVELVRVLMLVLVLVLLAVVVVVAVFGEGQLGWRMACAERRLRQCC